MSLALRIHYPLGEELIQGRIVSDVSSQTGSVTDGSRGMNLVLISNFNNLIV
jgi:hypothetical protein